MKLLADKSPSRLLAFFQANPDEELRYADAITKFDVSYETMRQAVKRLKRDGIIEVVTVIRLRGGR